MRHWTSQLSYLFFSASALVAGYIVIQITLVPFQMQKELNPSLADSLPVFQFIPLKPLDTYLDEFRTHALFYVPKAPEVVKTAGISELVAQYEVTGIIQGDVPEALIQNRSNKQTYFVQAGEQFDQLTVVEIREHGVLVAYGGEEAEMSIQEGV